MLERFTSLEAFASQIRGIPVLSREEEYALAVDYYENKNPNSAEKLVIHNLRYVYSLVTSRYTKYKHIAIDLIQEGNIGLIQSVKRFNPYKNVTFLTYATLWIKSYINRYLYGQATIVRRCYAAGGGHKLIKSLDNDTSSYLEMSIDDCDLYDDNIEELISLKLDADKVATIVNKLKLNEKDSTIIHNRLLAEEPLTLQEVANKFNVTRESIRQKEQTIIKKIRRELNE